MDGMGRGKCHSAMSLWMLHGTEDEPQVLMKGDQLSAE